MNIFIYLYIVAGCITNVLFLRAMKVVTLRDVIMSTCLMVLWPLPFMIMCWVESEKVVIWRKK